MVYEGSEGILEGMQDLELDSFVFKFFFGNLLDISLWLSYSI